MEYQTLRAHHEQRFIKAFIAAPRRDRWRAKLASRSKRRAFLDRLNHDMAADLDDRVKVIASPPPDLQPATLCCVIADEAEFDAQVVELHTIDLLLQQASFGVIVSITPGRLVRFQPERPAAAVWLQRG